MSNNYLPSATIIASISNANPGVVTTTEAHGYLSGLYVRLFFPSKAFGMWEVANNVYLIAVLSDTTFAINQDTSKFNVFDASTATSPAQVIPVAEVSEILTMATENGGNIVPQSSWITN